MTEGMELEIDRYGRLLRPGCHDASMTNFLYEPGHHIEITCSRGDGSLVRLRIDEILDANIVLWSGVIVSEIFIWNVAEVPDSLWSAPESGWNALFAGKLHEHERRAGAERAIGRHPNALFFELDTSYGGVITCIGRRVRGWVL